MNKVKAKKQNANDVISLQVVHAYAAGIDIGDKEHVVAVPEGLALSKVRCFGTMSCDLQELAKWLEELGIVTVAMESTGVYWKPLFELLIEKGFEVHLVNARHVKNVTGKKTDESDAEWIQKLHACGLLKSSCLPESNEQAALMTLVRSRRSLIDDESRFINRMQKSLELMNIKFHTVIADITGKTGRAVIEAILSGERNAEKFLPFIGKGIKANKEVIVKSLQGNFRDEHLFTLSSSYQMYKNFRQQIESYDCEIEKQLQRYAAKQNEGEIIQKPAPKTIETKNKKAKKNKDKNHPRFDVRGYLEQIHGVDVLNIYGISGTGGLEILSETGTDLSRWQNDNHFVSWLTFCPNNKISGGKLISSHLLKKKPNRASQAFRMAANAVARSDHWLGDYFRRMKAKAGHKYAIVATAAKLARIYYRMVRYKEEFRPVDLEEYQQKYKQAKIRYLERKLERLKCEAA